MKDIKIDKEVLIKVGDSEEVVALRRYVGKVDIVVTDPSYVMGDVLNIDMECETGVGDWDCELVDIENGKRSYGEFSSDCGFVCVSSLGPFGNEDVEKWAKKHPDCVAFVRKFEGVVAILVDSDTGSAVVRGVGKAGGKPVCFYSRQKEER